MATIANKVKEYIGMGARFVLSGSDVTFLMDGALARSGFLGGLQS